jgi:carbonic anhydrase/acetyltransferase-like protein (isoleucine patch superfamily)
MPYFTRTPSGAYIAHNATVTAEVTLSRDASIWFGAVVRGDVAPVTIGERVNIQDGAVVHCDTGFPNVIDDDVSIGPLVSTQVQGFGNYRRMPNLKYG